MRLRTVGVPTPPPAANHPRTNVLMSPSTLPTPSDPSEFFKPDEAIEQWKQPPPSGFPPEVPRPAPSEAPEWAPRSPQEVPLREPTRMPDWSPSSGDLGTPVIDEPQNPTQHPSGGAQPSGEHDAPAPEEEPADLRLDEDLGDDSQGLHGGGDPEDPGAQILRPTEAAASRVDSSAVAPRPGPTLRVAREEAHH